MSEESNCLSAEHERHSFIESPICLVLNNSSSEYFLNKAPTHETQVNTLFVNGYSSPTYKVVSTRVCIMRDNSKIIHVVSRQDCIGDHTLDGNTAFIVNRNKKTKKEKVQAKKLLIYELEPFGAASQKGKTNISDKVLKLIKHPKTKNDPQVERAMEIGLESPDSQTKPKTFKEYNTKLNKKISNYKSRLYVKLHIK